MTKTSKRAVASEYRKCPLEKYRSCKDLQRTPSLITSINWEPRKGYRNDSGAQANLKKSGSRSEPGNRVAFGRCQGVSILGRDVDLHLLA